MSRNGASIDVPRRNIFGRLYHGETNANFVGRSRLWFTISGLVILVGLGSLATRGLNLGIDFRGGTSWEVAGDVDVDEARDAVAAAGLPDADVQTLGGDEGERVRVQAEPGSEAESADVSAALANLAGAEPGDVQVSQVSPSWGSEITGKAQRALVVFLAAITLYITVRFEWKMAVATLTALIHDILVTVSVYSVTGFEVTPATVIAILTVLGYSIYDGIVVFDKVDENAQLLATTARSTYSQMVNDSLNQVLMRTLNTSITALIPIASLLVIGSFVLGAATLQEFALALLVGLGASAYSSIFIASPLLAILKEREPRYTALRNRVEGRSAPLVATGGIGGGTGGAAATASGPSPRAPARQSEPAEVAPPAGGNGAGRRRGQGEGKPATTTSPPIAPRPRKKGKRR